MKTVTPSDRPLVFFGALIFWLLIPVPFWLLGSGFAGELVFWPSFESDVFLVSLLWVLAFYGPLLLMGFVIADALRNRANRKKEINNAAD